MRLLSPQLDQIVIESWFQGLCDLTGSPLLMKPFRLLISNEKPSSLIVTQTVGLDLVVRDERKWELANHRKANQTDTGLSPPHKFLTLVSLTCSAGP